MFAVKTKLNFCLAIKKKIWVKKARIPNRNKKCSHISDFVGIDWQWQWNHSK